MTHRRTRPLPTLLLLTLAGPGCTVPPGSESDLDDGTSSSTEPPPALSLPGDEPTTGPTGGAPGTTTALTTTGSTTGAPDDTTGAPPDTTGGGYCGDGVQDPGEACDDGAANGDHAYCTGQCALNVCGDGFLLAGVELCDAGSANSDAYGSTCSSQCLPGARCGDGLFQPEEGEECDQGNDNGTGELDGQGLKCSEMCRLLAHRGFITSEAFTGDLGGLDGADAKCRDAAAAAGLAAPEKFRAALSTGAVSLAQRFADKLGDPTPYVLVGGQKFADSFADLITQGPGDHGISITEQGTSLTYAYVATNTNPDGSSHSFTEDCAGWTSADKNFPAHTGVNALPPDDPAWSDWKDEAWWLSRKLWSCDTHGFHLYCLE